MWSPGEEKLFKHTTFLISIADYEQALEIASELHRLVRGSRRKSAYVLGCKKAVALYHLGRIAEATRVFRTAYDEALAVNEHSIAAYILGDWSLIVQPVQAIAMTQRALSLCKDAGATPDRDRTIPADAAYLTAISARHYARAGQHERASELFAEACPTLKQFAYGTHPRYQDAYLVALMWEREFGGHHVRRRWNWWLGITTLVLVEVVRQKKCTATIRLLMSRRRMRRLRAHIRP